MAKSLWELEEDERKYQRIRYERKQSWFKAGLCALLLTPSVGAFLAIVLFLTDVDVFMLRVLIGIMVGLLASIPFLHWIVEVDSYARDLIDWLDSGKDPKGYRALKREAKKRQREIAFLKRLQNDPEFAAEWKRLGGS